MGAWGNPRGRRYHANEAFPTDPISMGGFEEWNYDSTVWDSNPTDQRKGETDRAHSGWELLRILARHGGYYLCGHVHHDERSVYQAGSKLLGIPVQKKLEFIRTTTAAASVTARGYWGYRMFKVQGRRISGVDYDLPKGLASLPAGNLWIERDPGPPPEVTVHSNLPQPTRVVIPLALPHADEGYRFRVRPPDGALDGAALKETPVVQQVLP